MMRNGQRTIKVEKGQLLATLKEHKEAHIVEYGKAVQAYKLEAIEQLGKLLKQAEDDKLQLKLKLIEPIDNTGNYDKIIAMFDWEVDNVVELTQSEFNEYVLDENSFTEMARESNAMYSAKWG